MTAPGTRRSQGRELLEMIKFQHALFALPFAVAALLAAERGLPDLRTLALVVACMVSARTAAMTWNRIADRRFDAANPRTRDRALPAGRVSLRAAWILLVLSSLAFLAAAASINRMTRWLAPVALAVILGYSLAKRVTPVTHAWLGASLALAPIGAWIAATGRIDPPALVLGGGVLAWTAGFDVLYACQDADFDVSAGLHAVPARWGIPVALWVARALHVVAACLFGAFGPAAGLGAAHAVAVVLAAGVLAWAHFLVRPDDLTRLGAAFFEANVGVAVLLLVGTAVDVARLRT